MPSAVFIVPGTLDSLTGGYIYDRRMIEGLRGRGWSVDVRELDSSFPFPTPKALRHAAEVLRTVPDGAVVIVDGLAFGALPDLIEREATRLRVVALVHLPLAADVGLSPSIAGRLQVSEQRALAAAALVLVTGEATINLLASYQIPRHKIVVVEPGTEEAPLARRIGVETDTVTGARISGPDTEHVELLCVATLNPGKGHDVLLRALAAVPHRNWNLTCVGSLTRHAATTRRVRRIVRELHLSDRVSLVGELEREELAKWYDRADLFVLATLRETYGMSIAEALARGLPVVSTTTGAIGDLVGDEAGVLVAPGDTKAFADALTRVLADESLRARLAVGAQRARTRLRSWEHAVGTLAGALEHLA